MPDLTALAGNLGAVANARRALLPLPLVDRHTQIDARVFPPRRRRATVLDDARVAVVAAGGSGATVALIGVARALEEAGIVPEVICACSGSVLWASMWAAGLSAQQMVDFALSWRPEDYLDIQWTRLPRFAFSALRGFSGLAKGEALERLFDRRLWHMSAGETGITLHTVAYNLDRGEVVYCGSGETPDLTLGELVRVAAAAPLVVEAVRIEGDLYVDGGVVDAFPAEPVIEDGGFERVFGFNVALPPGLEGEDIKGWDRRRGGMLDASRQLRFATHLELARRSRRRLGERLTLIEPVPHRGPGAGFYDLFLDRRHWPALIRQGHATAVEALRPFLKRARPRADGPSRQRPARRASRGASLEPERP